MPSEHFSMLWLPLLLSNLHNIVFHYFISTRTILVFISQNIIKATALCSHHLLRFTHTFMTFLGHHYVFPFHFSRFGLVSFQKLLYRRSIRGKSSVFVFVKMSLFHLVSRWKFTLVLNSRLTVIFIKNCVALSHSLLPSVVTVEMSVLVCVFMMCLNNDKIKLTIRILSHLSLKKLQLNAQFSVHYRQASATSCSWNLVYLKEM